VQTRMLQEIGKLKLLFFSYIRKNPSQQKFPATKISYLIYNYSKKTYYANRRYLNTSNSCVYSTKIKIYLHNGILLTHNHPMVAGRIIGFYSVACAF
jgi:hypothetical protein